MTLYRFIPAMLLASSLLSCSDDNDYNDRAMLSDIVTVASKDSETVTFRFRRYDDSPLITLTARGIDIKDEMIGKRALLRYYPLNGNAYTSGDIDIFALSSINCDTARIADIDTIAWDSTPIYLNSIWRSGEYINLHLKVLYSETPRIFSLIADSATIDSVVPQLYMSHNTFDAPDNFNFETYASFDISNIWNRPQCQGIDIHLNDTNLTKDKYSFSKQ